MNALSCFRDMEFPLNVYAGAQYLEYGKVKYLHYGLFTDNETSLEQAQQHSTDLILARLPSPPCRILEVGIGVGTTCRELTRRGYQVTGITPNGAQLALARAGNGADTYLIQTRFEDVYAPAAPYHVILFQE
ncbi:MAG: class I SAM-dependent methyltransferase, partial [Gammaproteobacteria bacterium]